MGFRDQDDAAYFELVRVNRSTGERKILDGQGPIEGRWAADAALKRAMEENRDPRVTFELQPAGKTQKKFRAAAFGDPTERMSTFKEPGQEK